MKMANLLPRFKKKNKKMCFTVTISPLQLNSKGHGNTTSPSIGNIQNTINIGFLFSVGDPEQD
jgi:hypothetical protein